MSLINNDNGGFKEVNDRELDNVFEDDGYQDYILNNISDISDGDSLNSINNDAITIATHSSNLYDENSIRNNIYTNTFRHGIINPYEAFPSNCKEYLFFTKPDLNIIKQNDRNLSTNKNELQDSIKDIAFWKDLKNRPELISQLEYSYDKYNGINPFNYLLQNTVNNNLDIPGLDAETIDVAENVFGTNFSYRGSSEASDDNPEFSLEFKDTKYLDVYMFFRAYEEYETLKHHGVIKPSNYYISRKILHDQFSIYKFILDDDMETILYYGKMVGVMPKGLPRDIFSNPPADGLTFSINFKAAFYEDMKPDILADFNYLSYEIFKNSKYYIPPYNPVTGTGDMRLAKAAYVYKDTTSQRALSTPGGKLYKLKWKGDYKI